MHDQATAHNAYRSRCHCDHIELEARFGAPASGGTLWQPARASAAAINGLLAPTRSYFLPDLDAGTGFGSSMPLFFL